MSLRVMTYNVRYFANLAAVKGAASTRRGVREISAAVAGLEHLPHVIGLQEVETRSLRSRLSHDGREQTQIQAFMAALETALSAAGRDHRYRARYFPAHTYGLGRARLYTTGLAILARNDVEVVQARTSPFDITHRPTHRFGRALKQSRICAHVVVQPPDGAAVDVFNTHLSLPNLVTPTPHRTPERMGYGRNQALEIQRLATFVSEHRATDRYVVLGDFNSLPGSPAYDLIQEALGVHDPFADVMGWKPDRLRSDWPTAGFLRFRMRLDHIFASEALRFVDFEDSHPYGRTGRWHGLSDHVPLLGRCVVRSPQVAVSD